MLKYENVAQVGDVIKAYDFEPMSDRKDSYLIGEVVKKGKVYGKPNPEMAHEVYLGDAYTIKVIESSSSSESFDARRMGQEMIVPFETSMDFDNRVEVV
jgi:hypothetical protein